MSCFCRNLASGVLCMFISPGRSTITNRKSRSVPGQPGLGVKGTGQSSEGLALTWALLCHGQCLAKVTYAALSRSLVSESWYEDKKLKAESQQSVCRAGARTADPG